MNDPFHGIPVRRIPIIGSDIYQVGQVYQLLDQSCAPDPIIAVKAAFVYLPTLLWTVLKPEPLDLAFDRAGKRHKRKRYRKGKIYDFDRAGKLKVPAYGTAIFSVAKIAERVGHILLIADATTDWAINWTSLAYEIGGCQSEIDNWGRCWGDMPGAVEPWVGMPWLVSGLDHSNGGSGLSSGTTAGVTTNGPWGVSFSAQVSTFPYLGVKGSVTKVELRMSNRQGVLQVIDTQPPDDPSGDGMYQFADVWFGATDGRVTFEILLTWTGGRCLCTDVRLQVTAGAETNLIPDP